ncbi:hypothetical protein S7711_10553 [Stachybotrys chartarum IBT 7711]|uniref:Uncharacterized protein n=1 Tax=Stachybotrys chartarum (strain CBS 109288 / IBT 7711) TaxID=1280523 RepID=A0A084ARN1_STACB|nr:hypothetical protein S7711_10553 [Stachybotrys chartarum IBT 7711]KFA48085.1 hypothetical protein S40293_10644 [Stachybotrys chartarum IBT 40293]
MVQLLFFTFATGQHTQHIDPSPDDKPNEPFLPRPTHLLAKVRPPLNAAEHRAEPSRATAAPSHGSLPLPRPHRQANGSGSFARHAS